jgi:hypothetical protein
MILVGYANTVLKHYSQRPANFLATYCSFWNMLFCQFSSSQFFLPSSNSTTWYSHPGKKCIFFPFTTLSTHLKIRHFLAFFFLDFVFFFHSIVVPVGTGNEDAVALPEMWLYNRVLTRSSTNLKIFTQWCELVGPRSGEVSFSSFWALTQQMEVQVEFSNCHKCEFLLELCSGGGMRDRSGVIPAPFLL